jgi:enediyne biosynthesis protein E4
LYVANYVDFTYENHVPYSIQGLPAYAGPRYYNPLPAVLYRLRPS